MDPEKLAMITAIGPMIAIACTSIAIAWVVNNWLRMRHGYPLESQWGKAIYPTSDRETGERVKLLTQENAQLRAEISSVKDRLANVERIVTDDSHRLTQEIEALRLPKN
jgi:hypothetical protein